MLSHFVAVCLALLPLAQCIQIHKYMTQEEVVKTFQTGHDNVPDYEIVRLCHTLHKRDINDNSTRMVKVNALGRNISLYLEPTEGLFAGELTPVWTVEEDAGKPQGLKYTQQPNVLTNIGQAYQDVSTKSAVVAYEAEDGETLVHGNLLEDLIVRPVPHRFRNTILRERRDVVDLLPDGFDGEAGFRRSHYHVVFKRSERDMNANSDSIRVVERERRSSEATNNQLEINIPEIIYPEVLIIFDHSLYKAIGKNVKEAVRYILSFWNAVDLRYRLLKEPVIRLNIAGIIISLDVGGTPYLTNDKRNSTKVNADVAIEAMRRYFYNESHRFPFATYDIATVMTGLNLCAVKPNGLCEAWMAGYAVTSGACNRNHVNMTTEAVTIVKDNGGYLAILPAAHELAHSMGVPHDGIEPTIDCPSTDGYLMTSFVTITENALQWSNCSLKYLHYFLSGPESTCLHNKPRASKALPRQLPGQLLTLDEQCEKIDGTKACYYDARVCTALACWEPGNSTQCGIITAAAEGSPCGKELHCINGYCVSKHAPLVPYTRTP